MLAGSTTDTNGYQLLESDNEDVNKSAIVDVEFFIDETMDGVGDPFDKEEAELVRLLAALSAVVPDPDDDDDDGMYYKTNDDVEETKKTYMYCF